MQYTFRLGRRASLAYVRYFSLRSLMTYLALIIVMFMAYTAPNAWWITLLAVLIGAYILILIAQWIRLFNASVQELLGVLIFLLTAELLPILLLYEAGRQVYAMYLM
jgi:hypothetical protein